MFAALAMGLAMTACAPKAEEAEVEEQDAAEVVPEEKTAKDYVASAKEISDVSYLIGINFGSFIKNYNFGENLNYGQIKKGMLDFINAKGNQQDPEFVEQFKVNPELMNEIFNAYLEKRHYQTLYNNKAKEEKFLAQNLKKAGVQVSESGLQYKIISEGNEVKPSPVDTVWVKYRGTTLDGVVFDETKEDQDAVKFVLNRVVKGWTEGLQLIGEGGEIELYVPAALGYGDNGSRGNIEPGATLIFNVSLEKVGKRAE